MFFSIFWSIEIFPLFFFGLSFHQSLKVSTIGPDLRYILLTKYWEKFSNSWCIFSGIRKSRSWAFFVEFDSSTARGWRMWPKYSFWNGDSRIFLDSNLYIKTKQFQEKKDREVLRKNAHILASLCRPGKEKVLTI